MSECIDSIKEYLHSKKLEFKDSEIKALVKEMENIRSKVFERGDTMGAPDFAEKAMGFIQEMRYQAHADRKQAAENMLKKLKNIERIKQHAFEGDPVEAIKGILAGLTARISDGGNGSVSYTAHGWRANFFTQLDQGLKAIGADKMMEKGAMDLEVMKELFKPGSSKLPIAAEAGKVIKAVQQDILKNLQAAGSSVREMMGYIMKQSHDRAKVSGAGKDQWVKDVWVKLDHEKTFGAMPKLERVKMLEDIWDEINLGRYGSYAQDGVSDQFMTVFGASANLSKKTSRSRSLHFADAESFFEYNKTYGNKNLMESVISSIDQNARHMGFMTHLGTDPEGSYNGLFQAAKVLYKDNPKVLAQLEHSKPELDRLYLSAQGLQNIPGTSLAARSGQNVRAGNAITKLGNALWSSFGDLSSAAVTMRSQYGGTTLGHVGRLTQTYLSSFISKTDRELWARRLSVFMDGLRGEMYARYGAEQAPPGTLSNAARIMNKYNGMSTHVESSKIAMSKQIAITLAAHVDTAFESLPARVKATLERYSINEHDWKFMGRAVEDIDGFKVLTPEAMGLIPDELHANGTKGKYEARSKLLNLMAEQSDMASTSVGIRHKAWMGKDEGLGVLARLVGQFRTVPLMVANTAERILLSNPESKPRNLKEAILQGKGDFGLLAQHMVLSTALGYVAMAAKDAAQGKTPKDPSHPDTWTEAFVQGGGGGVYADILLRDLQSKNRSGAAGAVLGPGLRPVIDVADLIMKVDQSDHKKRDAWEGSMKILMNQVPNLFWTKYGLDHMILNSLHESLQPGYLRKQEQRTKEDGQSYFLPKPTEKNIKWR